jgi:hypothetical protein
VIGALINNATENDIDELITSIQEIISCDDKYSIRLALKIIGSIVIKANQSQLDILITLALRPATINENVYLTVWFDLIRDLVINTKHRTNELKTVMRQILLPDNVIMELKI